MAHVEFGLDHITLFDGDQELVHWTQDEWEEDPSLVLSIVNATRILYEKGPEALLELCEGNAWDCMPSNWDIDP